MAMERQQEMKGKRNFANKNKKFIKKNVSEEIVPFNELTEAQRIAEGLRPPFVVKCDFSKTPREKELLKKVKRKWDKSQSTTSVWTPNTTIEIENRLTVHVSHPQMKTTHSYMLKPSEVRLFVSRNFLQKKIKVVKASYAGRPYKISA